MSPETRAALDEILRASEAVRVTLSDRIDALERRIHEIEERDYEPIPSPCNGGDEP